MQINSAFKCTGKSLDIEKKYSVCCLNDDLPSSLGDFYDETLFQIISTDINVTCACFSFFQIIGSLTSPLSQGFFGD